MESGVGIQKATEALQYDHRVIERVLTVLERLTETEDSPLERWQKAYDFIRGFADRCHHLKEEKLFFPALEQRGVSREGGPIGIMLTEHEEGRAYVRAIARALELAKADPKAATPALFENTRAYVRLLREHILKEDEVLFRIANDVLTPEEHKRLLEEFEEHEAREIGAGVHERYLKIVNELEDLQIGPVKGPPYHEIRRHP